MTLKIGPHQIQTRRFAIRMARQSTAYRLLAVVMFLASFTLVAFGNLSSSLAAQSQQQRWAGDVPIMADMSVEPELGFTFDSPNGRIVMIFASTTATAADIFGFYNGSLKAIGWVGGDGMWRRGPETLLITEVKTAAGRLWRLMIRPH